MKPTKGQILGEELRQRHQRDRAELENFSRYLRELGEWDRDHTLIAPYNHAAANARIRARLKAEVEIYERVYGEKI